LPPTRLPGPVYLAAFPTPCARHRTTQRGRDRDGQSSRWLPGSDIAARPGQIRLQYQHSIAEDHQSERLKGPEFLALARAVNVKMREVTMSCPPRRAISTARSGDELNSPTSAPRWSLAAGVALRVSTGMYGYGYSHCIYFRILCEIHGKSQTHTRTYPDIPVNLPPATCRGSNEPPVLLGVGIIRACQL
jgi:hypothetical protein